MKSSGMLHVSQEHAQIAEVLKVADEGKQSRLIHMLFIIIIIIINSYVSYREFPQQNIVE
jgi:hypothetical protein